MTTYTINDNGNDRPMTADEATQYEQSLAEFEAAKAAADEQAAAALEARKAPLRRLGLTEDEINTVLGF